MIRLEYIVYTCTVYVVFYFLVNLFEQTLLPFLLLIPCRQYNLNECRKYNSTENMYRCNWYSFKYFLYGVGPRRSIFSSVTSQNFSERQHSTIFYFCLLKNRWIHIVPLKHVFVIHAIYICFCRRGSCRLVGEGYFHLHRVSFRTRVE